MKTKILHTVLFTLFSIGGIIAQDITTVRANSSDISDNLDLQAVASIFGDSRDLEDFERRLNDPELMISNLDLNGDNRVDYLRVIEVTERNTHLIIIQSVLGADTFQDVATIEVERDRNNNVHVQVVGDVYMYGSNYIYEPVYVRRPLLYDVFWVSTYRPYYSPWYWGYYPTYYTYWAPYPVYRYRTHIHGHINPRNNYHYVNSRRSSRAVAMYSGRRTNAYERQNPNNGFSTRNGNASNRYTLEQSRSEGRSQSATGSSRNSFSNSSSRSSNTVNSRNINSARNSGSTRSNDVIRSNSDTRTSSGQMTRSNSGQTVRSSGTPTRSSDNNSIRTAPSQFRNEMQAPRQNTNNSFERSQAPAVRNSAPARSSQSMTPAPSRSNSSIKSTPPAQQRQSSPAPSSTRSSGNSSRSRG